MRTASVAARCCVVILAAVAVFLAVKSGIQSDEAPNTQSPTETVPTASPETGALSAADTTALNARIKAFVHLYFSLDPAKDPREVQAAVRPLATSEFIAAARFGFGSSEADQAMLREGASLVVQAISTIDGPFIDERTVQGVVRLRITKYDADGTVVTSFTYEQGMIWVKPESVWLVQSAPRT